MNEKQTHVLGSKIDLFTHEEVFYLLKKWLEGSQLHHIVTLNPEICLAAQKDEAFQKLLNRAELTIPDGIGLTIGARLQGTAVKERITGRQLMDMLFQIAVEHGHTVYLLGGAPGIAAKAADHLQQLYPGLRIAGANHGMEKGQFKAKNDQLAQTITASKADILLVAYGAPKQEQFIAANRAKLAGVKIAVGVGGLFDYWSGAVASPAPWMSQLGLEWLFRLVTQPWRWKRVFNATMVFLYQTCLWSLRMTFLFRKNAVAMILNRDRTHVLLASPWWSEVVRWQFPQGGIESRENAQAGVLREMKEELGTDDFKVLAYKQAAHQYTWPAWYRRVKGFRGQKQDLFILEYQGRDEEINVAGQAELATWTWMPLDRVLDELAPARKEIGRIGLDLLRDSGLTKAR